MADDSRVEKLPVSTVEGVLKHYEDYFAWTCVGDEHLTEWLQDQGFEDGVKVRITVEAI